MKTFRMFSIVLAVALFAAAFVPFAPAAARSTYTAATSAPLQAFQAAAQGLPLLSPMSMGLPVISMNVSNSSSTGYSCSLVRQTPLDWTKMRSRQYFDMAWTVENTGAVWHAGTIKLVYVGGTKMQTNGSELTLSNDVGRGKKIKLLVDMEAPKARGIYSTLWALYSGNQRFCKLTLSINVTR